MIEGNLLLKLRENFEDKFRYDEAGVPRIWRPTDDIEGIYTRARESTLTLIPLLSRFRLGETSASPPLDRWVGHTPSSATPTDEEDLPPIGGVDEEEGKSLEEEMTILGDSKRQELIVRFKKAADGVYVEAKRSAIGGMTQVPLYFYGILLALGWNEIIAGMYPRSISCLLLTRPASSPQPCLLLPALCLRSRGVCDVPAQPVGSDHEDDRSRVEPSTGRGQASTSRVP